MKRIVIVSMFAAISMFCNAQNIIAKDPETVHIQLNEGTVQPADLDSTLIGVDIFNLLEQGMRGAAQVSIDQPSSVESALRAQILANPSRKISGYRVRIFFDNSRGAREQSEKVLSTFNENHPAIKAYRGYENPYFKVTVGNFRTKSDAQHFLGTIKWEYPSAFIVKEQIDFPML